MSVAVVDSFQSIQIKEQHGELPVRALAALDFRIEPIHKPGIVGHTSQRIAGRLPTEVILQFSLAGDVLDDDFIGFQSSLSVDAFLTDETYLTSGTALHYQL